MDLKEQKYVCTLAECIGQVLALPVNDPVADPLCRRAWFRQLCRTFGTNGYIFMRPAKFQDRFTAVTAAVIFAIMPQ